MIRHIGRRETGRADARRPISLNLFNKVMKKNDVPEESILRDNGSISQKDDRVGIALGYRARGLVRWEQDTSCSRELRYGYARIPSLFFIYNTGGFND